MFKKIKQNKGITMMVLVVTIIVMLILAGVSVAVFNPNTGLVTKSKKIVNGYEASQEIQATETDAVIESLKDRKKRSTNITWAKSTSDWTNENVTVTAKANLSGYTLEISKDGKNWSKNTTIEVSQYGEEVFARLMNNSNNEDVQYSNVQITNIDKQAPTNNAPTAKVVTTNKIEVENNQVESGSGKNEEYSASGIKEVKYRLLSSRDAVESLEGYDWQDEGVFEKLTHNTTYYAQTYMKDNAGNETYSLVQEIKTVIVPSAKDFITQTPNTDKFTNKDKQILVSSINKDFNFEVSTDNKIWTTAVDGTITKTTTKNGDKVYARLTDGYNYGEAVVYTESLIDKDLPTTAAPTLKATTNAIKVSNNQKDATSKITTQYQIKKATETTWKDLQDSDTFSNLEQTTKYDVRTHSIDEAGNESYSSSATIETLTVPSGATTGIITLTANKTTWTNTDVIVTAKTSTSGFTMQMSTDGGTTFKDATSVTMTANGTVVARLRDASNNYGGIASKNITIIDKTAPSAPTIANSSNENWSNKDVTITLKATDNLSGIQRYEWFENGASTTRAMTFNNGVGTLVLGSERNLSIKFRTVDNANNISNEAATTVRIDKTLPTNNAPTVTQTTDTVTVTSKQTDASSGISKIQYQIKESSSSTWGVLQDSNKFTGLKQNTKYDVRTHARDNAGNEQDSVVTSVTTRGVPSGATTGIITLTAEPSTWTNSNVKVTATTKTSGFTMQMSTDGGTTFKDATSVTMTANGTVVARLRDASNNYGGIASKVITIIDKVAPSAPTITKSSNENWSNKDVTITLKATDNLSGINRYEWNEGSGWTSYSLTTTDGVGTLRLYQSRNSTIKIRAIDNANNISEETSTIVKMDKNVPPTTAPTLASSTTNSVTIKNNQIDPLSGNKTVQYQIKKNADSTWGNLQTSATFGNLVQNTKYDVRTYVTDNAGNSSYSNILTVKTLTVPSAITLQPSWGGYSAGTMKINATTTSTGYTIQMSLNSTNNFTDTSAVTASDNGTVYARLRDSSGNYGASASISINSIINNTNAKNHYGEKVNYHPSTDPNGVYRMFYYDEKGEFGKSKTVYLYRDYTDDAIMEIDESTSQTGFARFKELNPSYKDLIGNSIVTNTPTNAKFGTYLCDQNNFTRYLDSTKAYSVVGGPSIEMFIKSYNQVSHTINLHTITNVIAKTMDDGYKGYVFSIDGKEKYYDHNILDYSSQNGMYVNSQNRWTYLTSPSAYDDGYLFMNTGKNFSGFEVEEGDDYDGSVVGIHYRPLIALNESTVFNFE